MEIINKLLYIKLENLDYIHCPPKHFSPTIK